MSITENMKAKSQQWWKYTKISVLILALLGLGFLFFILFANYSTGTRTGYVTKISHKGYIFKTYEGELNFGFFGGTPAGGKPSENIWNFSVSNGEVARQVEEASKSGQKVTLHYKEKYITISIRGETAYIVYQVEKPAGSSPQTLPAIPQNQ